MKIREIFKEKKLTISFEIFPPKTSSTIESIYDSIETLASLKPDFISVTYGAGGSNSKLTLNIASIVENKYQVNSLAHLTCVGASQYSIDETLKFMQENNIENVLALRGDIPKDFAGELFKDFSHASDLIYYIKDKTNMCVGGACYPEGHVESLSENMDIKNLKLKALAGSDFFITQLFFDNSFIYKMEDKLNLLDVDIPIIAGIMPITNKKQIMRMAELSGCSIPEKLGRILNKYEYNPDALRDAGIIYACEQILDLITSNKIKGIHIYTMNKPEIAKRILNNISTLR
ncbi:MAG: methylenetetrahydrofolate reductase [NAD(P)H] [Oscillospiraceae bacterium]|nr:methylenetetrahydrofolate reductase [NAD(P)H] [Oscillospiraceae bacterium]